MVYLPEVNRASEQGHLVLSQRKLAWEVNEQTF